MTASRATADRLLGCVRLRAERLARWTEALWKTGQASPDQGPAIGHAEVARLLAPAVTREAEAAFHAGEATELSRAIADADAAFASDGLWRSIRGSFGLDGDEAELLALTIAIDLDPGLARVIAYLHDDGRLTQPTPWLAARLAGREPAPFQGVHLRRWLLATPCEGAPERLTTPWQADPVLAQAFATGTWRDPQLRDAAVEIDPGAISAMPCLHPEAKRVLSGTADLRALELVGPPGVGRQTLAAQYAADQGLALLAVDLRRLADSGADVFSSLVRTLRQAAMNGALAYFRDAEAVSEADWARARRLGTPFLRGARHPTGEAQPVFLTPLGIEARATLWRHLTDVAPPPGLIERRLTAEQIARAAQQPSEAAAAFQWHRRRPDSNLLSALPTPYGWEDLVLPTDVAEQLRAFESQIRLRWPVYEEWGFARLTHLGQGISALFCGPSGTGKTMAAQVMARSLGLELLRVDLAGVVNKYIGETEKKLREVFDACEDSGALLFFDEADALFGNRTQVKDAHDRFANIEIDYLLQRIERFDGVAILATNRRNDLDPAFVRRLRFVVEFLPPRPKERLAIWRRALPPNAPDGRPICAAIDWDYLCERLIMTGAQIKLVALGAAFLAREEAALISMRHLVIAAQREMAKHGERRRIALKEAGE